MAEPSELKRLHNVESSCWGCTSGLGLALFTAKCQVMPGGNLTALKGQAQESDQASAYPLAQQHDLGSRLQLVPHKIIFHQIRSHGQILRNLMHRDRVNTCPLHLCLVTSPSASGHQLQSFGQELLLRKPGQRQYHFLCSEMTLS